MRILVTQPWPYFQDTGGGSKSHRLLTQQLARLGHECHILTPHDFPPQADASSGTVLEGYGQRVERAAFQGVQLYRASATERLGDALRCVVERIEPDWVILPNDDHRWTIVRAALEAAPGRVVCLVHTLQQLPFGPHAYRTDAAAAQLYGECAGIVCVSRAAQDYVHAEGGLSSTVIYPYVYEGLTDLERNTGGELAMLVTPCSYKGIDIMLAMAEQLPHIPFAGVRGWATTDDDVRRMAEHDNVTLLEPTADFTRLLRRARVVLMPSLWEETYGYTCVEAMLHGVPVIASDIGGLSEAKLGVPYKLPVNKISSYRASGVEWRPFADVPPQDVGPWVTTLAELWKDSDLYASLTAESHTAANAFVHSLRPDDLERYLRDLAPR